MAAACCPCSEGWSQCHLRRIGYQKAASGIVDVIHFYKTVTLIGRNRDIVDCFLSYDPTRSSGYISRIHARVIRTASAYELVDSSLTGVYVNDVQISERVVLQEGDTVTFGHPAWRDTNPRARIRQPNSPFYFLFERCHCSTDQVRNRCGDRGAVPREFPVLASPAASLPVKRSVGQWKRAALPARAQPTISPDHTALPESSVDHGCRCPAASASPLLLETSQDSGPPLVPSLLPINSANVSSRSPEVLSEAARPVSVPEGALWPVSQPLRSSSPEYTPVGEALLAPEGSSPQRTLEMTCAAASFRGSPGSWGSQPRSGSEAQAAGCLPAPHRQLLHANCDTGEPQLDHASGPGNVDDSLCAPAHLRDSVGAEDEEETGGLGDGLPAPGPEEPVPGSSDGDEELSEMDIDQNSQEAAECGLPPDAQATEAARELVAPAVWSPGHDMEEEGPVGAGQIPEQRTENFMAEPLSETATLEMGWAADASLADATDGLGAEERDLAAGESANSTHDSVSSAPSDKEPGGDPFAELEGLEKSDSDASFRTRSLPRETWSDGGDVCETSWPERASDGESDGERDPPSDAGSLTECHASPGDGVSPEPELGSLCSEGESSLGDASYAEVGTQTESLKGRELSLAVAESGKEEEKGRIMDVFDSEHGVEATGEGAERGCSPERGVAPVAPSGPTQEDPPEACKEQRAPAVDSVLLEERQPEEPLAAAIPEQLHDDCGKSVDEPLAQRSEKVGAAQGSVGFAKADRGPERCIAHPAPEGREEASAAGDPAQGGLCALGDASPAEGPPGPAGDGENKHRGTAGKDGTLEEGEPIASATAEDAARQLQTAEEGAPEREQSALGEQESCGPAEGASSGRHEGDEAQPPSASAGGKARQPSPLQLGGGYLGEEAILLSGAGRRSPSRTGKGEIARGLEAGNGPLSPPQGSAEDDGGTDLRAEIAAKAQEDGVGARAALAEEDLQQSGDEHRGILPDRSALLRCQREPLAPASHAAELQHLETSPADSERQLPCPDVEIAAQEEESEAGVALEHLTPPVPGGCRQESLVLEEAGGFGQTRGSPRCREAGSARSLGPGSADLEGAGAAQGNAARNLPSGSRVDLLEPPPELCSGDELDLHISDSEAEREELDGSRALVLESSDQILAGRASGCTAEKDEACHGLAGDSSVPGPCDATVREAGAGPLKVRDVPGASLQQREMARRGKSSCAAGGEELEGRVAGDPKSVPVNLACVSAASPRQPESDAEIGVEEEASWGADGLAGEAGSDLAQGGSLMDGSLAGEVGAGTSAPPPEFGGTSETPGSSFLGKDEHVPGTEGGAAGHPQQGRKVGSPFQLGDGPGSSAGLSEGLESSESRRAFSLQEEEPKDSSSRKRHFGKDGALGTSDAEACSSSPKRLCPPDSGSELCAPIVAPSPLLATERHWDQFGRAAGKLLDQCSSSSSHSRRLILHRDEAEQGNEGIVAHRVREYFKSVPCPKQPAATDRSPGTLALPPDAAGEVDCQSVAVLDTEGRASCDHEPSSPCTPSAEVKEVLSQDGQHSSGSALSPASGSPTRERDGGSPLTSLCEVYCAAEEAFQTGLSSRLQSSPLKSPVASPGAEAEQAAGESIPASPFSDSSSRSAESDPFEPSPRPCGGSSPGRLSDGEAAGVDVVSGSSKASAVGWRDEGQRVSLCELGPSRPRSEEDSAEEADLVAQQRGGSGGSSGETGSEQTVSWANSSGGGTREEQAGGPGRRGCLFSEFLQRSQADSSRQETEHPQPQLDGPPASPPQEQDVPRSGTRAACSHVPLKREPSWGDHEGEGSGPPSPSEAAPVAASQLASSPAAGGPRSDGSIGQGSCSGLAPACSQDERSLSLGEPRFLHPAARDGSAEAEASGWLPGGEGGPSRFCPPSSGAAGHPGERGLGEGGDLRGSDDVAGGAQQGDARSILQAAAGQTAESGAFPVASMSDNRALACSPLGSKDGASAPVCGQAAGWPSRFPPPRAFKEEENLCESQGQLDGPPHHVASPVARSPVVSVPCEPSASIPEASASGHPDSPAGPVCLQNKGTRLLLDPLDEAVVPGQLDPEGVSSSDEFAPRLPPPRKSSWEGPLSTTRVGPWPAGDGSACTAARASGAGGAKGSDTPTEWASSEQDVEFQLRECRSALGELSRSLCAVDGVDGVHLEKWREQVADLQKATEMPQTCIAVVGNTGAGKSCLLNALLDEEAMLPTSAMRACTAVVVEISRAAGGRPYEADVAFLSREEWHKELEALLADMKDKSGNLKKRCPDRKTEAGAAYSRVKAVYGAVDELAKLQEIQDVTQHLGTVMHIAAETAADFRSNIERFIDSRTDNLREMRGGEFWPIVKCVRIRVAKAEVLRTGAVLVDLPGIRDSNAARDSAAKEYLKDCHAVWVVASITRAVDDKTAKEVLSANLRRQLLMDGRYGSLAFVCTKTDTFNVADIVRDLALREEIQLLEAEVRALESRKMQAEAEKQLLYARLEQEQRQGGDDAAADPAWLHRRHEFLEKEFSINDLQKQKDAKLRAISLICVQARNKFSKQQISVDFSAGLEEMRRAAFSENEDDGDEDLEDGDASGSEPDGPGETGSQPRRLPVFTVSATEYLKLCGKLLRDGQAQVFHDTEDTEVPALKKFAMETALKHSMVATEKVARDLARVLSQIVNYLTSRRAEDRSHQAQIQEIIQQSLEDVPSLLQEAIDDAVHDMRYYLDVVLLASLTRGVQQAKEQCEDTVKSLGLPENGLPHSTYHAVCVRRGVYTSPKYGCVDLNSHLAAPIYTAIAVTWHDTFSSKLEESITHFAKAVLDKLKSFFKGLRKKLGKHSSIAGTVREIYCQEMEAARARLLNFSLDQGTYISSMQRTISRILVPEIQAGLDPAYAACSHMTGPGYFKKMKQEMEAYVHREKSAIFDSAANKMHQQLNLLQQKIQKSFQSLVQELSKSLKMQLEPVLKPIQRNARILPELMSICAQVDKICKRSCVEYVLPSPSQVEDAPLEMGREVLGNWDPASFSAAGVDVRMGTVPLPHITTIQVSEQDVTFTRADGTPAALPLREVSCYECCLPLGYLILHISSEAARAMSSQFGVQMSSARLGSQKLLVLLGKARGQDWTSRLMDCISSRHRDALGFQVLSLEQGREQLESLGVCCAAHQPTQVSETSPAPSTSPQLPEVIRVVQQPGPPQVNLHLYSHKRAGEAVPLPAGKKLKGQTAARLAGSRGPAGDPLLNWTTDAKEVPCAQRSTPHPFPATGQAGDLENCRWKPDSTLGAPQHPASGKAAGQHFAISSSAAKEEIRRLYPSLSTMEQDESVKTSSEAPSWRTH